MFQSVGLVCFGLAVILFIVVPIVANELDLAPERRGLAGPYIACAMALWGLAMIFNGAVAIARNRKRHRTSRTTGRP
jgi:hypothetical protein